MLVYQRVDSSCFQYFHIPTGAHNLGKALIISPMSSWPGKLPPVSPPKRPGEPPTARNETHGSLLHIGSMWGPPVMFDGL